MWYVEYWDDDNDSDFPLATAYVWEYQDGKERKAELSFIFTVDHERRQGIGTKLVRECEKRWPDIRLTDPISDGGHALARYSKRIMFDNEIVAKDVEIKRLNEEVHRAWKRGYEAGGANRRLIRGRRSR
jgi:GNAT superfamily N-acetyltransferase